MTYRNNVLFKGRLRELCGDSGYFFGADDKLSLPEFLDLLNHNLEVADSVLESGDDFLNRTDGMYDSVPYSEQKELRDERRTAILFSQVLSHWKEDAQRFRNNLRSSHVMASPYDPKDDMLELGKITCELAVPLTRFFKHILGRLNSGESARDIYDDCLRLMKERQIPKRYYREAEQQIAKEFPFSAQPLQPAPIDVSKFGLDPAFPLLFMLSRAYRHKIVREFSEEYWDDVPKEQSDAIAESRFIKEICAGLLPDHAMFFRKLCAAYLERVPDAEGMMDIRFQPDGKERLFRFVYDELSFDVDDYFDGESLDYESPSALLKIREGFRFMLTGTTVGDVEMYGEDRDRVFGAPPTGYLLYATEFEALWALRVCVRFFDEFGYKVSPASDVACFSALGVYYVEASYLADILRNNIGVRTLLSSIEDMASAKDEREHFEDFLEGFAWEDLADALQGWDDVDDDMETELLWMLQGYLCHGFGSGFLLSNLRGFRINHADSERVVNCSELSRALSLARVGTLFGDPYNFIGFTNRLSDASAVRVRSNALACTLASVFGVEVENGVPLSVCFSEMNPSQNRDAIWDRRIGLLEFVCTLAVFAHDFEIQERLLVCTSNPTVLSGPTYMFEAEGVETTKRQLERLKSDYEEIREVLRKRHGDSVESNGLSEQERAAMQKEFRKRENGYKEELSSMKKLLLERDQEIERLKQTNAGLRGEMDSLFSSFEEIPSGSDEVSTEQILSVLRQLSFGFVGGHTEVLRHLREDGIVPRFHVGTSRSVSPTAVADCVIIFTDWTSHKDFWYGEKIARQIGCPHIFVSGATNYELVLQKIWNALPSSLKKKAGV